jgi:hypothetical protein
MLPWSYTEYEGLGMTVLGANGNRKSDVFSVSLRFVHSRGNWGIKPSEPIIVGYFDTNKKLLTESTVFVNLPFGATSWNFTIPCEHHVAARYAKVYFGNSGLKSRFIPIK